MSVIFYYDIVCPFAYMASHLVEAAVKRAGGVVKWTPVLLGTSTLQQFKRILKLSIFLILLLIGGLYKETHAPQGKDGSSMDVMAASKLAISSQGSVRHKLTIIIIIIIYFVFIKF